MTDDSAASGTSLAVEDWLEYCRSVVRDGEHLAECAAAGGSVPGDPDGRGRVVYPEARWPGSLGKDYQSGGLLWLNIVHEDLGQLGLRAEADAYAAATALWRVADRADRAADDGYLTAQRRMYSAGLVTWNVRSLIHRVAVEALGFELDELVYANAARCQVLIRTDGRHGKVQDGLVGLCQGWLPISRLIDDLKPAVVIYTSKEAMRFVPARPGLFVVGLTQRFQVQRNSPWQPSGRPWLAALEADWAAFDARRSEPDKPTTHG